MIFDYIQPAFSSLINPNQRNKQVDKQSFTTHKNLRQIGDLRQRYITRKGSFQYLSCYYHNYLCNKFAFLFVPTCCVILNFNKISWQVSQNRFDSAVDRCTSDKMSYCFPALFDILFSWMTPLFLASVN